MSPTEAGRAPADAASNVAELHGSSVLRRNYVLVVLTLVFVVNYVDRQLVGLLLPLIQRDFALSYTALGFLTGTVFVIFYGIIGLPLAVVADRVNRRNIIAVSIIVFSSMTVLSGLATQFWHLVVTRLGTGFGEAGTSPASNSIVSDLYPPEKRASALAFYFAGLNIGLLLAYFGGGWVAEHYGWRVAFMSAGVPGLLLVVLLLTTVKEPRRSGSAGPDGSASGTGLLATSRNLLRQPAFKWIALGGAMQSFGGYANVYFLPSFLFHTYHLSTAEIGLAMALMSGVCGAIGTFVAGLLADRLAKCDVRWQMYVPALAILVSVPFSVVMLMASDLSTAFIAGAVTWFTSAVYLGPSSAIVQGMVPAKMRAQSVALLFFIYNMIALGAGPPTVGYVSDYLQPTFGADSVRYALLVAPLTSTLACICWFIASRHLKPVRTRSVK